MLTRLKRKVQAIEREMQLSQPGDASPVDKDDQDCDDRLLTDESLVVCSARTAATPSRSVLDPSRALHDRQVSLETQTAMKIVTTPIKLPDVTTPPKAPRYPSVFVPTTPSQNKHKDVFGSDDTDLSEPSDSSEADSMKALSQKLAARTDSLIAITKRASVLTDTVSSAGISGKKAATRRVLDSDDEEALSSSGKGAKGGPKPGASNAKNAVPAAAVSDEDGLPPPPAPLKSKPSRIPPEVKQYSFFAIEERPKPTKKPEENPKPAVRGGDIRKRRREDKDDGAEAGGIFDVQEKPPPAKRARKPAKGKPAPTRPKAASPAPPRDSQVLRKSRPAAKKNANYSGHAKVARISSPARDSVALLEDDEPPDALDLKTQLVEPRVKSLVGDGDDDDYAPSPPVPKSKPKPKAASRRKPALVEKPAPLENPKANTVKTKGKAQTRTRTRAAATKVKFADNENVEKAEPPQKTKAKAKRKPEVVLAEEGGNEEGEGETTKVESTEDSPVFIEVSSSPPERPKPKHKPVSRVTLQEVLIFNSSHSIHASRIVALIRFISGTCKARTKNRQSDNNSSRTEEEDYYVPEGWRFSR